MMTKQVAVVVEEGTLLPKHFSLSFLITTIFLLAYKYRYLYGTMMMKPITTLVRRRSPVIRGLLGNQPLHHDRNSATRRRASSSPSTRQRFCCLDLRHSGLSVIERLCLEECLLRHDPSSRQWIIWGTHDPMQSRYLNLLPLPSYIVDNDTPPQRQPENPCIVVMGIGGKPELLLDIPRIKERGVWVIKRFSGGGTVVVDHNCIYTTIIGRNGPNQLVSSSSSSSQGTVPPYPREIMEWTATDVFGPAFAHLKEKATESASSSLSSSHLEFPDFELKENDYVLGGTQKVAGNAQSIVKTGFLHHTSFLWSYSEENMKYLTLPAKRPDYRKDRAHSNFLIQLQDAYHNQLEMDAFFASLQTACEESFELEHVSLDDVLSIVTSAVGEGGIQHFFDTKSRTRFVDLP